MSTKDKQLPAIYEPPPLPEKVADLTDIQRGWLALSKKRDILFNALERGELQIQNIAAKVNDKSKLEDIQAAVKEAADLYETNKQQRVVFTQNLKVKLTEPAMAFEKRNEEVIEKLKELEFTSRKAANEEAKKGEAKTKETALYRAHITNENNRIGTAYRIALEARINFYFQQAMKEKKKDKKTLAAFIKDIKAELPNIELDAPTKFTRSHVTNDEARAIVKEIPMYDSADDLEAALKKVDERFETYDHDIKNAAAAAKAAEAATAAAAAEAEEELKLETSTANLVASADSYQVSGGGAKTKIKEMLDVEVENTEAWGVAVITQFAKHFNMAKTKLLVKSWEKLSLGQMAKALGKLATESDEAMTFTGLKLIKVEK